MSNTVSVCARFATWLAALALAVPIAAWADPPPHAPAHGWRKKHDPYYLGYSGKKWPSDYGIVSGRCDRAAIGAVLGGVAGGVIGSTVGKGDGRTVAIIVGTVLGAAIGAKIGSDMDAADQACVGHALELAGVRRSVSWTNETTGVRYVVTPLAGFQRDGQECREFVLSSTLRDKHAEQRRQACRGGDGEWRVL